MPVKHLSKCWQCEMCAEGSSDGGGGTESSSSPQRTLTRAALLHSAHGFCALTSVFSGHLGTSGLFYSALKDDFPLLMLRTGRNLRQREILFMKPARNEDEPREFFGSSLSLARARGKKPTLPAPVLLSYFRCLPQVRGFQLSMGGTCCHDESYQFYKHKFEWKVQLQHMGAFFTFGVVYWFQT